MNPTILALPGAHLWTSGVEEIASAWLRLGEPRGPPEPDHFENFAL